MSIRDSFKSKKPILSALSSIFLSVALTLSSNATTFAANTILVCTKPGADVQKVKNELTSSGCTILKKKKKKKKKKVPCKAGRFFLSSK